jgi:hypothetical protein
VYEHRRQTDPVERRADQSFDHHRVRVRQRPRLGIEDVGVEQPEPRLRERVREPREPPHVEVDVVVIAGVGGEMRDLRPGQDRRQRHEHHRDGQRLTASFDHKSIPIICISRSALRDVASPGLSR